MLLRETVATEFCGSLADYTRPALIVPELRERDTAGVVKELSQVLHQQGCVPDVLAFYHAALNHEFLVNSAMECGIAIPHARLNGVANSSFAYGHTREPFTWGSRPSPTVQFVFLLAVPATDAAGFLQLLSALARLGREDHLLAGLRAGGSTEEIFEFFKQIKVRHG
jgi:mannitol/fructose-specific phosphotransferase system IIA component (Ntr-type)